MTDSSRETESGTRRPRWIALGFVGAFAASVFTVIYTGLNVGGYSSAEFDAGHLSTLSHAPALSEQRSRS